MDKGRAQKQDGPKAPNEHMDFVTGQGQKRPREEGNEDSPPPEDQPKTKKRKMENIAARQGLQEAPSESSSMAEAPTKAEIIRQDFLRRFSTPDVNRQISGSGSKEDGIVNKDATSSQGSDGSHHSQVSHYQISEGVERFGPQAKEGEDVTLKEIDPNQIRQLGHNEIAPASDNEACSAIDRVSTNGEKMSIVELKGNFNIIRNYCKNNDIMIKKYLTGDEIKELNNRCRDVEMKFLLHIENENTFKESILRYIQYCKEKLEIPLILNDLRKIGKDKPLGYLPINTITEICKETPENLEKEALDRGLHVIIHHDETEITMPCVCVYDHESLKELLQKNTSTLEAADWPTDPKAFVDKTFEVYAPAKTKLFDVIADAFADYTNSGRTDVMTKE